MHLKLFQSPNQETSPHERIYRITPMYPDDPRSPFFNENGDEIAPLARLHLNRINVIPKSCSDRIITDLIDELTVSENSQDIPKRKHTIVLKYLIILTFFYLYLMKMNYVDVY